MSDLSNFKNIADELMADIQVDKTLKDKVMSQCYKKRTVPIQRYLAQAACLVLILGLTTLLASRPPQAIPRDSSIPENYTLMIADAGLKPDQVAWSLRTIEEARMAFGDVFLTPSYMPEGYSLAEIQATGDKQGEANKILIHYQMHARTLTILEEKASILVDYSDYKIIDINGTTGYLKPDELHWFSNGTHYTVLGFMIEDEAVKTARLMK